MRKIINNEGKLDLDSGIFFGAGVFETILVKEEAKFLDYHFSRLDKGLIRLGLKPLYEKEEVLKYIESLNITNKALKITVTEKNIIITYRDIPYTKEDYNKGFKIKISEVLRNSTSILPSIKSINYIENIIEKRKAVDDGFDDVLFFNEKGYLCETSTSNIFCIKDGVISTPKISNGLLNGTVRNWVIENYNVYENNITKEQLKNMDEVFVTNSLFGIMKIKYIEEVSFKNINITSEIAGKYNEIINGTNGGLNIYGR